jgi:flagellar biosynthetic protein FliR
MLETFTPNQIFGFLLIFARVSMIFQMMPGIGEQYVPRWVRLGIAIAVTLIISPLIGTTLPAIPATVPALAILVIGEIVIGILIGSIARITVSALHTAGTIIAFQTSLAYAQTVDPNQDTQAGLIAAYLNLLGVMAIFFSGLHFLLIMAVLDSYQLFPPGQSPIAGDMADAVIHLVSQSFAIGLQMASPFVVYGIMFYLGLGLLQRLMPQIQLFFIAIPLQLFLGFVMLLLITSASMMWFLEHFQSVTSILVAN